MPSDANLKPRRPPSLGSGAKGGSSTLPVNQPGTKSSNPLSSSGESTEPGFRGPFAKQAAAFARVRSPGGHRFSSWFGDLMACVSYGSLKALAGGIEADRQRGSCGPGISARTSIRSFPKTSSTMSTRYEEVFAGDDA